MKKYTLLIAFISISILLISCAVRIERSREDGKIEEISRIEIKPLQKNVTREEVDELDPYPKTLPAKNIVIWLSKPASGFLIDKMAAVRENASFK